MHQPLAEGKGVVARQGLDASQSRKQNCGLRNTKHVRGYPSRASWQQAAKPNAIKDLGSKRDKRAGKVNVLTWGDLLSGFQSNPDCEVRLRQQGSAEVIVPNFFFGKD